MRCMYKVQEWGSTRRYCSTSIASFTLSSDRLPGSRSSNDGGSCGCVARCGGTGDDSRPGSGGSSRLGPHNSACSTERGSFGASSTMSASSSEDASRSVTMIPIAKNGNRERNACARSGMLERRAGYLRQQTASCTPTTKSEGEK